MSKPNKEWYIENNDLDGAYERYNDTSPRWKKEWFEICEKIFSSCAEWAKKYTLDPVRKVIQTLSIVVGKRKSQADGKIFQASDCSSLLDEAKEKCYLFEFFDADNNLLCSKVGTTTRDVRKRLSEELKSKTYTAMGAVKAIIHRVYDCGNIPAEGLESYFRAEYIKRYPDSFKKNDRFIMKTFDLAEADKIAAAYLATNN